MKIKKILQVMFILSLNVLHAQSFFTLGANYTTMGATLAPPFAKQSLENFKLTPTIGYGYNINFSTRWSYQPSISLSNLGCINVPDEPRTVFDIYAAVLDNYFDFKANPWLSFSLSPSCYFVAYAGITGKTFNNKYHRVNWKDIQGSDLNRLVISLCPRMSIIFWKGFSLNFYYRSDITSVGRPLPLPPGYKPPSWYGYGLGASLKYQIISKE